MDLFTLQEEKKDLQTKINSNPENPDVPVLRAMLVSTNIQIAATKTSVRKEIVTKGSTVKKTTFPSYAKLVHSNNGKRYRQRRIVARKKTNIITPRDFQFIDRVYVKLFNREEWIVDLASLEHPYEDGMEFLDQFAQHPLYQADQKVLKTAEGYEDIKIKSNLPRFGKNWSDELQVKRERHQKVMQYYQRQQQQQQARDTVPANTVER